MVEKTAKKELAKSDTSGHRVNHSAKVPNQVMGHHDINTRVLIGLLAETTDCNFHVVIKLKSTQELP
ncbi:hypothetical protein EYC80_008231 [Monilinia laxa]|uniref:Uncharacterized protein n=1 Tax=Monilinia laxa TaxID=61186 RepID=A0A5N6JVP8_MONLA|nr:hypothetical protein EYC80_008231 [Monilinia laxa]